MNTNQNNLATIGVDVSLETGSLVGLSLAILVPLVAFVLLIKFIK